MPLSPVRQLSSVRVKNAVLYGSESVDGNPYRRAITITEQSGNDLTDFQVRIDLNSSNFDFSKSTDDGSDIRITDESGNKLPFWIEKWDSVNEEATIWVKVPSIPANSTITLYLYYGNTSLTSESNGANTFDFFDDFDGIDSSIWTKIYTDNNTYAQNSVLRVGSYAAGLMTTNFILTDGIVEAKWRGTSGARGNIKARMDLSCGTNDEFSKNRGYDINYRIPNEDENLRRCNLNCNTPTFLVGKSYTYSTNTWYIATIKVYSNTIEGKATEDAELMQATDTSYAEGHIGLGTDILDSVGTDYIDYDWIRVRKYASPEPSVSVGDEETITEGGNRTKAKVMEVVR